MPANLYAPSRTIDWSRFKDLPNDNVVSVDVAGIQARLDANAGDPRRWHEGTFRCPEDARPEQYERIKVAAIKRWLRSMETMGWVLRSRIAVFPSKYEAREPNSQKAQAGLVEYVAKALFEKEHAKPIRVEIPSNLLKPVVLK